MLKVVSYGNSLSYTEKNGFVTATKLGTTNEFFVASTKNFAAATKRLLIELSILLLQQNIFVTFILTDDFAGITKPFFRVTYAE